MSFEQVMRERDTAIGILHRHGWCHCGHQHAAPIICMSCNCDDANPMSYEELAERIAKLAEGTSD